MPLETLRGIWIKAKDLLKTPGAVINGPRLADQEQSLPVSPALDLVLSPIPVRVYFVVKALVLTGQEFAYAAIPLQLLFLL